ncbi:hypothetical protein CDL15_Pgr019167 [Punica granatum]|uniref:Extensin-like n=1 Tax=Punica granatum TaxID=22663 RepID=A0A218WE15_PUNGR|nr:hypothetical protein CDL15_Pgr019167 [Punica granatum]
MTEEDRVDISEEVNPPTPTLSQPPPTHAPPPPTPAGVPPVYLDALPTHLQPPMSLGAPFARASQMPSASDDQPRIAALEGTVNQMATSMAELLALLKGSNRASSSSTLPPGPGPTADPIPWAPPIQAPENVEALTPPTLHTFTSPYPPSPAPTAVPLPPATLLSSGHVLSVPPPVPISALTSSFSNLIDAGKKLDKTLNHAVNKQNDKPSKLEYRKGVWDIGPHVIEPPNSEFPVPYDHCLSI